MSVVTSNGTKSVTANSIKTRFVVKRKCSRIVCGQWVMQKNYIKICLLLTAAYN